MKNPDAIYVGIVARLDWLEPPETTEERARRQFAQTAINNMAKQVSAELSTLFTELLKGGE